MGKTAGGAVWLDPHKTTPYEFYQYWINTDDRDVERFLAFFTFLPMTEVKRLGKLEHDEIREAKNILAYEATKLAHGKEQADRAQETSQAAFGGKGMDLDAMPTTTIAKDRLKNGIPIMQLFHEVGLANSRSEARRLIDQGGAYVNEEQQKDIKLVIDTNSLKDEALLLRAGKKRYHRILLN